MSEKKKPYSKKNNGKKATNNHYKKSYNDSKKSYKGNKKTSNFNKPKKNFTKKSKPHKKYSVYNSKKKDYGKKKVKRKEPSLLEKLYGYIRINILPLNFKDGEIYVNMLKGLKKSKKIVFSKDCKMERILYIVYLNKDNKLEIDKIHLSKPESKFKKGKVIYQSEVEINFKDLKNTRRSDKTDDEEREIKYAVRRLQEVVGKGYYITSLPKKKEECKAILDIIDEFINQ